MTGILINRRKLDTKRRKEGREDELKGVKRERIKERKER